MQGSVTVVVLQISVRTPLQKFFHDFFPASPNVHHQDRNPVGPMRVQIEIRLGQQNIGDVIALIQ